MFRKFALGFATTLAFAAGARADVIQFDPDGPGGEFGTLSIAKFDFLPGNVLADQAVPVAAGNTFGTFYQARLGSLIDSGANIVPLGAGREITLVVGYPEIVVGAAAFPGAATFAFNPAGAQPNYFAMYFDSSADANDLAGTGFTDGVLIARGTVNLATGNFSAQLPAVLFDQVAADDHGGAQTLQGIGGGSVAGPVATFDPAYFISAINAFRTDTLSLNLPFTGGINPALLFNTAFNGGTTTVPSRGATNGVNGPDFQFLGDASISFTLAPGQPPPPIPEPATLAVFGLVAGVGGLVYRKRRNTNVA